MVGDGDGNMHGDQGSQFIPRREWNAELGSTLFHFALQLDQKVLFGLDTRRDRAWRQNTK